MTLGPDVVNAYLENLSRNAKEDGKLYTWSHWDILGQLATFN
jgi:hypothetical protein